MGITINELIEFCEEEEYGHRIRCKQYDDASEFTRSGNKDIRTACAIREEIKMNYYQQMINTMRKYQKLERVLDKIRADITDCIKALDDVEKFNIYLPNEITGRRLTYQQCLEFIDKYKGENYGNAERDSYQDNRRDPDRN